MFHHKVLGILFLLSSCLLPTHFLFAVNITWTNGTNVNIVGNSVTKTSGSGWVAGATSAETFTGDGTLEFTAAQTNRNLMCGLTRLDWDTDYSTISFAIYLRNNGSVRIMEGGNSRGDVSTYATNDVFEIERSGSTIIYKQNATTIYTSTLSSIGAMRADCSLNSNNGTISNAQLTGFAVDIPGTISDLTAGWSGSTQITLDWSAPGNQGDLITAYTIEYGIGDFASTYNDDAMPGATITGLSAGGNYQFRVYAVNGQGNGNTSNVATVSGFAEVTWTNTSNISTSGGTVTKSGSSNAWDAGGISLQNFSGDGYLEFTAHNATTARMCGLTILNTTVNFNDIDYCLYLLNNGTVRVYELGTNRGTFGNGYTAGDLFRIERSGTNIQYYQNGTLLYTSLVSVVATKKLYADCSLNTASNNSLVKVALKAFNSGSPESITDLSAGWSASTQVTLDWTEPANQGSQITGYTVEYGIGDFASTYNDDASPGATITGLAPGGNYQFRVLATNSHGTSSASNTTNITGVVEVFWTDTVNVSTSGSTITKSGGSNAWDAGGRSRQSFDTDGYLEFMAPSATVNRMCGLTEVSNGVDYIDIAYAIYLRSNGQLRITEGGINRGDVGGTYAAGDIFKVQRNGTVITYYHNDNVLYTSTLDSTGTLFADCSLNTVSNNSIANAKLKGFTAGPPGTVSDLFAGLSGATQATLNWTEPANQGFVITSYTIEYGIGNFASTFSDDASPGCVITGLTPGGNYQFRLKATNTLGDSAYSNTASLTGVKDVIWTDFVNTTATGSTLTKTGGSNNWDAGAASIDSFAGDIEFRFTAAQANRALMCGLSNQNLDEDFTSIGFAIYLLNNGSIRVYEGGGARYNPPSPHPYNAGDVFSIKRTGTTITYLQNNVLFYTSSTTSSGSLYADCSMNNNGGIISNARFVGYTSGPPGAVTDLVADGGTPGQATLTWSAPGNQGFDITEYEIQYNTVASANFNLTYVDDGTPGATITGLTPDVQYQFRLLAKNMLGTGPVSNTAVLTGYVDVVWTDLVNTAATGSQLTKSGGGNTWDAGAASVNSFEGDGELQFVPAQANRAFMCGLSNVNSNENYTSISYAIYAMNNGRIRVYEGGTLEYDPGALLTYTAGDVLAVNRTGSTITYKKNGVIFYTSLVDSSGSLLADCSMNTLNSNVIASARMSGFTAGAPSAITDLFAGWTAPGSVTLDWTAPGDQGSPISAYEVRYGTVVSGLFDTIVADDNTPGIVITGLDLNEQYQFVVYSENANGTSPPSNVATMTGVVDVVWTNFVNTTASGSQLTKTGGGNAWDAGASSLNSFAGDGELQFVPAQANRNFMCGLSTNDADENYTSIGWAIHCRQNGMLRIYEGGQNRGDFGNYTAGDTLSLKRVGTAITYYINGNLLYTSGNQSSGNLLADCSMNTASNNTIASARITGFTSGVPGQIVNLAVSVGASPGEYNLTWSAPATQGIPITAYVVQYGTLSSGGFGTTLNDDAIPGAAITGLQGASYQFRVAAVNALGTGPFSNVATTAVLSAPITWTDLVGTISSGNTLIKNLGNNGWNAGGASVNRFTGDGGFDFTVTTANRNFMAGLSSANANANWNTIHFALYIRANGNIEVREAILNPNGSYSRFNRGLVGTYTAGDRFTVQRTETTVNYKKNGLVLYTSTIGSTGPLIADAAINTNNGEVADAYMFNNLTIQNFTALASTTNPTVTLSWVSPSALEDPEYAGLMIRYATTGFPDNITDGILLTNVNNTTNTYTHTNVLSEQTYYYTAFAYNFSSQYESGVVTQVTTPDLVAPDMISNLIATPGIEAVTLTWINPNTANYPNQDFTGVMIRRSTTSYPATITDGVLVAELINDETSFTDSGLSVGPTYYYSVFSYDDVPLYSNPAQAFGVPFPAVDRLVMYSANAATPGNTTIPIQTSGIPLNLRMAALDSSQNPVPQVNGSIQVVFDMSHVNPPSGNISAQVNGMNVPGTISIQFNSGISEPFTLDYQDAGQISLTARSGTNTSDAFDDFETFSPLPVTFIPYALQVSLPNPTTGDHEIAGQPFDLQIEALSATGSLTPNYQSSSVRLSTRLVSGISLGTLSETQTSITEGSTALTLTYNDIGTLEITATDPSYFGMLLSGTTPQIIFTPYRLQTTLSAPPSNRTAFYPEEPITLRVTAVDFNQNRLINYRGSLQFSGLEGLTLDPVYQFTDQDLGEHTFQFYAGTEGTFSLSLQDQTYADLSSEPVPVVVEFALLTMDSLTAPLGTTTVSVRLVNANGEVISEDQSTTFYVMLIEQNSNQSATSQATNVPVQIANGTATFDLTDTEAEIVTVSFESTPKLPFNSGTVQFLETSTAVNKGGIRIVFWREMKDGIPAEE